MSPIARDLLEAAAGVTLAVVRATPIGVCVVKYGWRIVSVVICFLMTQLDDVKSRLDIVELVGGYVQLQRSGSSFKANCPFHDERTPSFFVFPDRQSWRCFGACAEGGDAFSFVMKKERVDFREALVRLGARVGITITDQAETGGRSQLLFEINDAARQFFQRCLAEPEADFVRDYLLGRGLNDRSLQVFEFGYSPARGNRLLRHLTDSGYATADIAEAGLARETEDGRHYDLFRAAAASRTPPGGSDTRGGPLRAGPRRRRRAAEPAAASSSRAALRTRFRSTALDT